MTKYTARDQREAKETQTEVYVKRSRSEKKKQEMIEEHG